MCAWQPRCERTVTLRSAFLRLGFRTAGQLSTPELPGRETTPFPPFRQDFASHKSRRAAHPMVPHHWRREPDGLGSFEGQGSRLVPVKVGEAVLDS